MFKSSLTLILFIWLFCPFAAAGTIDGPVPAELIRVIDGDTVLVRLTPWFGQSIEVSVRLYGIDAPEMKSRCQPERQKAHAAKRALEALVAGKDLHLRDIHKGKYFGRVIARLEREDGLDVSQNLLQSGLVQPYRGAQKSSYCQ